MSTFEEARNTLLSHYSDSQTSQGARLIGFAVALFTLIQTVQSSGSNLLSTIFPTGLVMAGFEILTPYANGAKAILLFAGILVLMTYIVRTMFRFAVYSGFASYLINLLPFEVEKNQSIQSAIHNAVIQSMINKNAKLYWVIQCKWFIASECHRRENRNGWILALIIALILTSILVWLLW